MFKPYNGEVLDGVVREVDQSSITVEVGPLQAMISEQCMPEDYSFDPINRSYISADGTSQIKKNSEIRFKVMGLNVEASCIRCSGTIKEEYLGLIDG